MRVVVKHLSTRFDVPSFNVGGVVGVIDTVEAAEVKDVVASRVPVDGIEVVEWMHYAAAANSILDGFIAVVSNDPKAVIVGASGDPYIPGVRGRKARFVSMRGRDVRKRGKGYIEVGKARYEVPLGGKTIVVTSDEIIFACLPFAWRIQWLGVLLEIIRPPTVPLENVPVPSFWGNTAPVAFMLKQRIPLPFIAFKMVLSTNKNQPIKIAVRDPEDYTQVWYTEEISVKAGKSEMVGVVPMRKISNRVVLEVRTQNGTKAVVNKIDTIPPSSMLHL